MKILKLASITLAFLLLLAACETQDAYTGEKKVNKATKYGAIGAVLCGVLGSRKDSGRAQKAALACGLAGVSIGAYMDAQERKLRQELVNSGVQIVREGDNLRLVMPNSITFASDQATLNTSIYNTLSSVVKVLNEYDETLLQVAGHTDSTGSSNYNQRLSVRRASSVADYLRSQGVDRNRLFVVGYGETRPVVANNTVAGRAENRRVELLIEPDV
ncbi:MAG: outer membrane protein OmpA-like peptidoglycan-associated protein [Cellvibrionaceae bacterium]|jgi:outer membrane protein OmpA-like peptidoglycan-associated protein